VTFGGSLATAGSYSVFGCRTPDGSMVPVEGWRSFDTTGAQAVGNDCRPGSSLPSLYAAWTSPGRHLSEAGWQLDAPLNMVITACDLYRYATYGSGGDGIVALHAEGR
jgi:hypothetical protein